MSGHQTPDDEDRTVSRDDTSGGVLSRRQALIGAGTLLGGTALLSGNAVAADDDEVDVLNYALTLEHLEDQFYEVNIPSQQAFEEDSEILEPFGEEIVSDVHDRVAAIGEHESEHVRVLSDTIEELGGDPVEAASYDFLEKGYDPDPDAFLELAMTLENTGVYAYNGAIDMLDRDSLVTAAATITTVEARHASYLTLLNHESPFPRAFDRAFSMSRVLDAIEVFIEESDG